MSAAALALLLFGPVSGDGSPAPEAPDRLLAVAPGLWSGAEPTADAHFAALARLGVGTVVSVDGPVPNAAAARRHGLRTVHVPIGYDGVPPAAAARLAAAMGRFGPTAAGTNARPGGVFVHCHHGKHRGPTAAAVCGLSAGLLTRGEALALLDAAGAAPRYAGLWETVRTLDPAAVPAHLNDLVLPEAVPPEGLTAAMDRIEALLGSLQESHEESVGVADSRRESATPAVALLAEALRESARLPGLSDAVRGDLRRAAGLATRAHTPAGRAALERDCARCHAVHRD